jgi:AraC-like DNA-binding protein
MDALGSLLTGPRAHGAFMLRSIMDPPWSMRIQDEAPLTVVAIVRGSAWIVPDDGEPVHLRPGDIAVARGQRSPGNLPAAPNGWHYTVADDPATPPQIVIHPGQRCTTRYGADLADQMSLGVRSWGNSADGETVMLTGTYELAGEVSQRLLSALPMLVVLRDGEWDCPLIPLLASEIVKDDPGQEAVLDRLLDLLVIAVLRAWFGRAGGDAPRWYRANSDPVVGHALRLIHNNPGHGWTVANLAAATGMSRAALARKFTDLVGEPPMAYVTGWRLALAADLLHEPGATLEYVARQVGYGSAFALSAAFKRVRGISPREHRTARLAS